MAVSSETLPDWAPTDRRTGRSLEIGIVLRHHLLERELGELRRIAGHFLDPAPDGLKAGFVDLGVSSVSAIVWP
jgi:hypothetical protein